MLSVFLLVYIRAQKRELRMKMPEIKVTYILFILACILSCHLHMHSVSCQCLDDQKSLLLELRNSLQFNHSYSTKLVTWNESTDCCRWGGITCNVSNGQVIGLDLTDEGITGGLHNSSSLFQSIGNLKRLKELNLSSCNFDGVIPSSFTSLNQLESLDLSDNKFSGPIPNFSSMKNIQSIDLHSNQLSGSIVSTNWGMLLNLESLDLSDNSLTGSIPASLFLAPSLREIDLAWNKFSGRWEEFETSPSSKLEVLFLRNNDLEGPIPNSISQLRGLRELNLEGNRFNGTLKLNEFLHQFTNLTVLWLSDNCLSVDASGTPPTANSSFPQLKRLGLGSCNLGVLPRQFLTTQLQLEYLHLPNNHMEGAVPAWIWNVSDGSLRYLNLYYNNFEHLEQPIPYAPELEVLDLTSNDLEGPIPNSISQLRGLTEMYLEGNRFNGTLKLNEFLHQFTNLTYLRLSDNCLSVDASGTPSTANSSFPQLWALGLGSCNLGVLPRQFLTTQLQLEYLDLSNNHMECAVPTWIWNVSVGSLSTLNLSDNNFEHLEQPIPYAPELQFLDLHSNNIQGELPSLILGTSLRYLDCSSNNFTSVTPDIGNHLPRAFFLSLARNHIYGTIPISLCNATYLQVLDLEHNRFKGTIPHCLVAMTNQSSLAVLNARGNNLSGEIPDIFGTGCSLETADFNGNFLQRRVPKSLANCTELKVLDLGNNRLNDTFPCELKSLLDLRVLVLRSNNFRGSVSCPKNTSTLWPSLQILDLASNQFNGGIPSQFILQWKSMTAGEYQKETQPDMLQHMINDTDKYYQDAVTLTFKDHDYQLQKSLSIYSIIDLSDNSFQGNIPQHLGILNGLKALNLSRNSLSGHIPSSLGNLTNLESLDLSRNGLTGKIPLELANLNFLEVLNLSFNKLEGLIPTGTQLQSFDASSYKGNKGLYGPPLTPYSASEHAPEFTPPTSGYESDWNSRSEVEWMLRGAEVGFPVGLTIFVGPLLYIKRWRLRYCKHLERLVMKILQREDQARGRRNKSRRQQQQQKRSRGN